MGGYVAGSELISNVVRRFFFVFVLVALPTGSVAEAASRQKTDGTIVNPIVARSGTAHYYNGPNVELDADLADANLNFANLSGATFSIGTILSNGQTVLQHGFDADGLQTYLKASPVSASNASNLNIVPEPANVFLLLTGLLMLARVRF